MLPVLLAFSPPIPVAAGLNAGDRAPNFELEMLNGSTVSLFSLLKENNLVVLSFFGTWCGTCLTEIQEMPEIVKQSGAKVYLVGLDADKGKLERFVNKHNITFPVLWDPNARAMGKKYDLLRGAILLVPKTVLVSRSGSVEYTADSYDEARKASLTNELAKHKNTKWEKPSELVVFFTGSANGRIKATYSNKKTAGGYIKLLSLLNTEKNKYPNHLLLDAGDFLPYNASAVQAAAILKVISLADYDAVAMGDQDLYFAKLTDATITEKLPIITSNIVMKSKAPGLPEKTVTVGGIKVRILSYTGPETFTFYPEDFLRLVEFKTMKESLNNPSSSDLVILLSHAGIEETRNLAKEFPQINLIIAGHSQAAAIQSEKVGDTLLVTTGENLQNVGKVLLRFDGEHRVIGSVSESTYESLPLTESIPDDPRVENSMLSTKTLINR